MKNREQILLAIRCRLAALQDGRFWTSSHRTDRGSPYDQPEFQQIAWDCSELFGRPLNRTERDHLTKTIREMEAALQLDLVRAGNRTVAVQLLIDPGVSDEQRQAFEQWRLQFGKDALAQSEAAKQAKLDQLEAEQQRADAEQKQQDKAKTDEYNRSFRTRRQHRWAGRTK